MTALVTSALLFSGSIDALKSAVVLTSLPFSLILLLMMWGLHKAFYLESQKQIAQMHSLARSPVAARPWRLAPALEPGGALPVARRGVPLHGHHGAPGD
jgi:choline-glycine betaine transporter